MEPIKAFVYHHPRRSLLVVGDQIPELDLRQLSCIDRHAIALWRKDQLEQAAILVFEHYDFKRACEITSSRGALEKWLSSSVQAPETSPEKTS